MRVVFGLHEFESWADAVHSGHAFVGGVYVSPVAATISEAQLKNPAGSGVVVVIRHLNIASTTSTTIALRRHDADLANDYLAGTNLRLGGAAAAAHVRYGNPAAVDGTLMTELNRATNSETQRFPEWVAELDAGESLVVACGTLATELSAEFFWVELPA